MASEASDDDLGSMSSLTPIPESSGPPGSSAIPLALRLQLPYDRPSQASSRRVSSHRTTPSRRRPSLHSRISTPPSSPPPTPTPSSPPYPGIEDDDTPIANPFNGYYAHRLRKFDQKALNGKKLRKKELLQDDNWLHWKSRIMRVLRSTGRLHEFALDTVPPPDKFTDPDEYDAWYELDQAVLEFIHGSIDSEQLTNIPGGLEVNGMSDEDQTSADFWDNICSVYESHSYQSLNNLLRILHRKHADENSNIPEHLFEMQKLRTQLANIEYVLDDHVFNGMIISSLPTSWDIYTTTIHGMHRSGERQKARRRHWSRRGHVSTVELVSMLKTEYERRKQTETPPKVIDQTYQSSSFTNTRPNKKRKRENETQSQNLNCKVCRYTNHTADNCKWPKNGGYCLTCQRGGHWTKNCKGKEPDKSKRKGGGHHTTNAATTSDNNSKSMHVNSTMTATSNSSIPDLYTWLADSATTSHIVGDKKMFYAYHEIKKTITGVGATHVNAVGIGSVLITSEVNGKTYSLRLHDVLHVPGTTDNLLSVGRWDERGGEFRTKQGQAHFYDGQDTLIISGKRINALYYLNIKVSLDVANLTKQPGLSWLEWHKRFGHIAVSGLQHLKRQNLVEGFNVDESSEPRDCEPCVQAKQAHKPFPKSTNRKTTYIGELTHMDLWGPARFPATNGSKYYITFIDDYSRHCTMKLLKTKTETSDKVKEYIATVERILRCQAPMAIQADNGKEFVNTELRNWLSQRGIDMRPSAPYSPQQNGTAERYNRTIADLIRAMLIAKNLPKILWGTAALHATYLRNRAYTRRLTDHTPLERWCKEKPNVTNLQEFGTPVSILNESNTKDKLDARGNIHIFVGFEDGPDAIKYFDVITRQVKLSRNYHFLPQCENPPQFEGECLEEGESLWETPDTSEPESRNNSDTPLTIKIPKRANIAEEEDDNSERQSKRQKTSHPYVNQEASLFAEIVYAAFNQSGLAPDNPFSLKEAKATAEWPQWEKAIETELDQLQTMGTWDLVDLPEGRQAIGNKWVFLKKYSKTGELEKYKARLVAKGYAQIPGMDFSQTFSPVVRMETIRTILSLAVNMDWELTQMDVKGAYLNGQLEEEVFMRQPEGFEDGTNRVCRLIKTLYGLKQSGREWNKILNSRLTGQGFNQLNADPCAYIRDTEDHIEIITVWVDDLLLFTDEPNVMDKLKKEIQTLFEVSDLGSPQKIVGIEIDRDRVKGRLKISQAQYIENLLAKYNMTDCKPVSTPMDLSADLDNVPELPSDSSLRELYASLIGALMFLAIATRPDIIFAVVKLATYVSRPGQAHWVAAKRILRYLKGTKDLGITYVKDKNFNKQNFLRGYSDASFNSEENAKSMTGYTFLSAGAAITWGSRKQTLTALSSTEAECLALTEATQEIVWLRTLLDELKFPQLGPTPIMEDNKGAIALTENPHLHRRSKHFIREKVTNKELTIEYLETSQMTADVLTKALSKPVHEAHVKSLGMASD